MKKPIAIIISTALALSLVAMPTFAADATTGASAAPDPGATAAPAAPAAPAAKPAESAPAATVAANAAYTVVSGDVFWKIAQKNGMTVQELAALNPQIKNINVIFPGQKINVKKAAAAAVAPAGKLYQGIGMIANYRDNSARGADRDNLNITTVAAIFNEAGKIVELEFDVLEITPSLFPGWMDPEAEDKSFYKNAQVNGFVDWATKREEGDGYAMKVSAVSGKEWWEQMDFYEEYFKGKTVAEVQDWFVKYCDANGRPYKMAYPEKLTDADKEKIATFTEAEKKMLVDVTTNATMALQDPHSRFVDALQKAWDDKKELKTSL